MVFRVVPVGSSQGSQNLVESPDWVWHGGTTLLTKVPRYRPRWIIGLKGFCNYYWFSFSMFYSENWRELLIRKIAWIYGPEPVCHPCDCETSTFLLYCNKTGLFWNVPCWVDSSWIKARKSFWILYSKKVELSGLKHIALMLVPKGTLALENVEFLTFAMVWVLKRSAFMSVWVAGSRSCLGCQGF